MDGVFVQGFAVVTRHSLYGDSLRSFHASVEQATQAVQSVIDANPIRVESAEVTFAHNGNVRMWRLTTKQHD